MNKKIKTMILLLILIFIGLNTLHAVDNTTQPNNEIIKNQQYTKQENTLEDNTPHIIDITEENYHNYFTQEDELNQSQLRKNTQLNIHSIPQNTQEIGIYLENEDINLTITGKNNLTLNNTGFIISSTIKNLKISNITLNYNQSYEETSFLYVESLNVNTENYILENININCIQNKPYYTHNIHPLDINAKNMQLNNITIDAKLPSNTITFQGNDNKPQAIALNIQGQNITLNNTNINLTEHDKDIYSNYNTIYALYNEADNFTITNTNITIQGEEYVYALISRSSNNKIYNNNITAKSTVYSAGINIEGSAIRDNIITNNTIHIEAGYREKGTTPNGAEDSAYGLMLLDYSYKGGPYTPNSNALDNNTYTYNTITGSAGNIYAIEVFGGTNTNLSSNNINITGRTPMGIGAIGENVTITNNNITCTGQTNNTEASADYLKPRTTGIYAYLSTSGITMDNNNINTTKGRGIYIEQTNNTQITNNQVLTIQHDYAVEITGTNNTIEHNYLISRNHEADDAVRTTKNNTITDNTNTPLKIRTITALPEIHAHICEEINITANITDSYNNPINTGYVTFMDIYEDIHMEAPVENGKATVTLSFNEPLDTILIATYTPTDTMIESSQTENILTIEDNPQTTLNLTTTQNNDNTLTITTTITTNDSTSINTGKITIKINGKTMKDNNNKIIYLKVTNNQATINYNIPSNLNGKEITIQATYSGSKQCEKLTSQKLIIKTAKTTPTLTTSDITATAGETITLTASITDGNNIINTGKAVFKINGKTVKDANGKVIYAKVVNNQVTVTYILPNDMKAKEYNITVVFTSLDYDRLEDTKTLTITA